MLETIVYLSTAADDLTIEELRGILARARRNNAESGVTGVLLFAEGSFIQALEGETEALEATMARIRANERHHNILEIYRSEISERSFPGWKMGFRAGDNDADNQTFKLTADAFKKHIEPNAGREVLTLLRQFYVSNYRFDAA